MSFLQLYEIVLKKHLLCLTDLTIIALYSLSNVISII